MTFEISAGISFYFCTVISGPMYRTGFVVVVVVVGFF